VTRSEIPREGVQPYDEIVETIQNWSPVLNPHLILIFGGEPLLHPRIKDIVREIRKGWPNARISLPTNGLLLKNIIDKEWLDEVAPIEIRISMHKDSDQMAFVKPWVKELMSSYKNWRPNDLDPNDQGALESDEKPYRFNMIQPNGVSVALSQYNTFQIPYTYDESGNIAPCNSDPEEAYSHCIGAGLAYLYKKQLWKCVPYPNLKDTIPDFDSRWPTYTPYNYNDDLTKFFDHYTRAEPVCKMCPNNYDFGTTVFNHQDPNEVKVLPTIKWFERNKLAK
jgi:hypothetical protein